jgi:hypothetical protein
LSKKPEKPERFFFLGAERVVGREVAGFVADLVGLDEEAAGVVLGFSDKVDFFSSVPDAFFSLTVAPVAAAETCPFFLLTSLPVPAAASPALSSLTSAGMGRV